MNHEITSISIRRLGAADESAVRRLAELDSAPVPEGRLLGAEVEGRVLAAVSLDSGELVSDPFARTDELRSMLELRVAQLRRRLPARRRRFRPARARGSLAGSPPGAGGRLISLPRVL